MLRDRQLTALRNRFKREAHSLLQEEEPGGELGEKGREEQKHTPLPRINRHSVFWILASVCVTYCLDFVHVVLHSEEVKRRWLAVGAALLAVSLCLSAFCVVYLEWFRGVQRYEEEYPAVVPLTVAAFAAALVSVNVALWPVWSLLTPLVLSTQCMGLVMLLTLLG